MKNHWTKEELEVYLKYQKLCNCTYDCIWIDMDDEDREKAIKILHRQMIRINKSVNIYINSEYINTFDYSLIDFIQEETPNKLLTWIPANFETRQDMLRFLESNLKKELQFN